MGHSTNNGNNNTTKNKHNAKNNKKKQQLTTTNALPKPQQPEAYTYFKGLQINGYNPKVSYTQNHYSHQTL